MQSSTFKKEDNLKVFNLNYKTMNATLKELHQIINQVLEDNDLDTKETIQDTDKLRDDLGFDSLQLAELTVCIEDEFDVDVFESGIVETVGEIFAKLSNE